jgi:RNA-binding protein 5/10
MSLQIHPSGFRISDKPVAASFAHQYSFQQVDHMLRDETAIPSSINLGGVEGAFVKYWDDSAMVAVLEFKVEAPPQPQVQASTGPTKEKKEKKKKGAPADCSFLSHQLTGKYIDDASNKPPAPSALPISDKPVTLSFNKGGPGSKPITSLSGPKAPAQISLGFSAEDFAAEDDDAEAATSAEDNKGSFICCRQLSEYELTFGSDCIEDGCPAHRKQEGSFYCV